MNQRTLRHFLATLLGDEDRCWEWPGRRNDNGYGLITPGRAGQALRAHRVSWELLRGPIPKGYCVLHRCDNPPCVNPRHLFVGTMGDNNRDMFEKQRAAVGIRQPGAKLTDEAVRTIRVRKRAGHTQREIARDLGVSEGIVSEILSGKRWHHVT